MVSPIDQYYRHKDAYNRISQQLDVVRESFVSSNRFTQKVMLFDSMAFAVISVQNSVSVLSRAFRGYCNADTWDNLQETMRGVNYGNNKFEYIKENFDTIFSGYVDEAIKLLEDGETWDAVEILQRNLFGVSFIKAPFVVAMLGFKEAMCIDTNVAQMVENDDVKAKDYSTMDQYLYAVSEVKQTFDELSTEVSTFMLQWIVFDANRGEGVEYHEEWFEHMLPGSPFGRQTGLEQFG